MELVGAMVKLLGAQRMVLKAILDLPKDAVDNVSDADIAKATRIAIEDVRAWLGSLDDLEFVRAVRTEEGLVASITDLGKMIVTHFQPFGSTVSAQTVLSEPRQTVPLTPSVRTILFLGANPKDTVRLRLDEEVRKIELGFERAKRRDQFKLVVKWAVTDDDLRRALLDHEPEIVHFSGHGVGSGHGGSGRDFVTGRQDETGGLAFEDGTGQVQLISGESLSRLFELCSDTVKCVVLNACYSEPQADAIAEHIDYVVGMKKAIGDEAAIKFAVGFYDALGAGRDVEKAFKFGCSAIDLKGIPEYLTPVLKKKQQ